MRPIAALLCLVALASPAVAGDYRMTATGQIFFTVPNPIPAPYSHIVVGAPFGEAEKCLAGF